MLETRSTLEGLIKAEVEEGTPLDRIVLGGFSQGGTMTLLTGLTIPMKLGGMVILSGRLALKDKFKEVSSSTIILRLSSCIDHHDFVDGFREREGHTYILGTWHR